MRTCSLLFICFVFSVSIQAGTESTFEDIVKKIKEDDGGRLILLNQHKTLIYLKHSHPQFERLYLEFVNSLKFKSPVKITLDQEYNVRTVR